MKPQTRHSLIYYRQCNDAYSKNIAPTKNSDEDIVGLGTFCEKELQQKQRKISIQCAAFKRERRPGVGTAIAHLVLFYCILVVLMEHFRQFWCFYHLFHSSLLRISCWVLHAFWKRLIFLSNEVHIVRWDKNNRGHRGVRNSRHSMGTHVALY